MKEQLGDLQLPRLPENIFKTALEKYFACYAILPSTAMLIKSFMARKQE
jgi:hypothetical protein